MTTSRSVLVYEDNELLRESLVGMLQSDPNYYVSGCFAHALDAEAEVERLVPDVILMDIDMPGRSGIDALRQLRARGVQTPIIMLTVFDDTNHVFDAICAGASGYILKKQIATKLFSAIDEVLTGGAPMSPSIARMVITSMQPATSNKYQLTPREKEVLSSLSKGNSYKMIAAEFAISLDTVRAHVKKIYEKLQVHSQTEAVSKAINERLV